MKRILITGGCGFIGSSLAVDLLGRGFAVTVLDNLSRHGSDILRERVLGRGARFVHGDVRDPGVFEKLPEDYALMVMCSGEASAMAGMQGQGAGSLLDVNLLGAIHCFEWARERRVAVIFLSSSRVYPYARLNACRYEEGLTRFDFIDGCPGVSRSGVSVQMPLSGPRSFYGASKLSAEIVLQEYAAQYGLAAIINRCGVVSGPWQLGKAEQGVFAFWMANHYFKKSLSYIGFGGTGKQVRDLLHVDDLAALVHRQVLALTEEKRPCRGDIFNVGGSSRASASLLETTVLCAQMTGNDVPVGRVLENRAGDMVWYITDNGVTEETFDWRPLKSVEQILGDVYGWMRGHEAECRRIFYS